mmetsp:Transcript_19078/g.49239  ORF Transcript_19078/g.49239 Transcript_19078/m.49239 type:complete len:246 (+) Transcript_19078:824-1561(+)
MRLESEVSDPYIRSFSRHDLMIGSQSASSCSSTSHAVEIERDSHDAYTRSNSIPCSRSSWPARMASAAPSAASGTSSQPVNSPSLLCSVLPCRMITTTWPRRLREPPSPSLPAARNGTNESRHMSAARSPRSATAKPVSTSAARAATRSDAASCNGSSPHSSVPNAPDVMHCGASRRGVCCIASRCRSEGSARKSPKLGTMGASPPRAAACSSRKAVAHEPPPFFLGFVAGGSTRSLPLAARSKR